ncbi:MAG: M23 family metallopeptidase [Acidobacteriota bacterium]
MLSRRLIRLGWALCVALGLTLSSGISAQSIDWPIGDIYEGEVVPGYRTTVQQNYANRGGPKWFGNRPHAGIDLQYLSTTGGSNGAATANRPVYAVADGIVRASTCCYTPGHVVVIEHQDANGHAYTTQYGHLNTPLVLVGDTVHRGTMIGTIYNQGANTHLHYEVRDFLLDPINNTWWGPGYGSVNLEPWQQGWLDPVAYHFEEAAAFPRTVMLRAARNVRSAPHVGAALLHTMPAGPVIADGITRDSSDPQDWWYKVRYPYGDEMREGYMSVFVKGSWGADLFLGEEVRWDKHYVPGILNSSTWDTNLYIRNLRSGSNSVHVDVNRNNGSSADQTCNLTNNGSCRVSLSGTITIKTAVVTADHGDDLAVVARLERKNSSGSYAYASWEGIDRPRALQRVPLVHYDNYGFYNRIFMHNPASHGTVRVEPTYSNGCQVAAIDLAPGQTKEINTYYATCLSNGWVGTLELESFYKNSPSVPAPIAVMSLQEDREGSHRVSMAATAVSWPVSDRLYMPLIHHDNYGIIGGIAADELQRDGYLSVSYREDDGLLCDVDPPYSPWPGIGPTPASSSSPCATVLAGIGKGMSGADRLHAQISQIAPNQNSSAFPAEVHPSKTIHIPFLEEGSGRFKGIQIFNTKPNNATVTVRFYGHGGNLIATRSTAVTGYGSWTLQGNDSPSSIIPPSARNAEVYSISGGLAVVVNNIMSTNSSLRDQLMDYTGAARSD